MLITHIILAAIAVGALATRPQSIRAVLLVALAAAFDALLGAPTVSAVAVVGPPMAFLTAALTLAALVERSRLAERAACALSAAAGRYSAAVARVTAQTGGARVTWGGWAWGSV